MGCSGRSASESKMEPDSLARAPKWSKRSGAVQWVMEEDERYCRNSQTSLRNDSGWWQSQIGFTYEWDGHTFCAVTAWTEAYLFNRIRTKDGDLGVHIQDGGNAEIKPPFTDKEMSDHWTHDVQCVYLGQTVLTCPEGISWSESWSTRNATLCTSA